MLHNHLYLPYTRNICNSNHLMTDLQTTELNRDTRIFPLDIENMYTNVPKRDIMTVINNILQDNSEVHMNIHKKIMHTLQIMVKQNYFQFYKISNKQRNINKYMQS